MTNIRHYFQCVIHNIAQWRRALLPTIPKYPPKNTLPNLFLIATMISLAGCGGGGGGSSSGSGSSTPTTQSGRLVVSTNGTEIAVGNISYNVTSAQPVPNGTAAQASNVTGLDGSFAYTSGSTVTFTIGGSTFTLTGASKVTVEMLAAVQTSDASLQNTITNNIKFFLLNSDDDHNPSNGINLNASSLPPLAFTDEKFISALTTQLVQTGTQPISTFTPALGMNTEAAQAEQDTVVQSVPFADIFRVARPFQELSSCSNSYDGSGWVTSAMTSDPNCARTIIAQGATAEVLPEGQYTVLYEGSGTLVYGGYASLVSRSAGRDIINIKFNNPTTAGVNRIGVSLSVNNPSNPLKNIRIVMPGGICEGNPFVRVADASGCPAGKYKSFVDTLAADRNAIVFNPDYLNFMKDFRVVRMMNFTEASPRNPCTGSGDAYNACLLQDFNWSQRAKMTDATWGGSARITLLNRYARGVPLEVQVELANQLNAHPWFNMPHNATDDYVTNFASYVRDHLKSGLKAHIEYTNEAWNNIFWGSLYVRKKGMDLGLGNTYTNQEYWAGALYYAKRATEIFKLWENAFADNSRLVRVLGTVQTDTYLTRNMLNYSDTKSHVDAVAMNAYFLACLTRASNTACADTTKIPKTLNEVTTLDEIFAAIDNANDPYGLPKLQSQITAQATEVAKFGKALYAYEGGQHLTVDSTTDATRRPLFEAANRDPRMGDRYTTLLNAWKTAGGQQFMLYTQPQSFHTWGLFGIKETLLQARSSAKKYDAIMKFQETIGKCWWNGC